MKTTDQIQQLGPIQQKWIEYLKTEPPRAICVLGKKDENGIKCCFLGSLLMIQRLHEDKELDPFRGEIYLYDTHYTSALSDESCEKLGLYGVFGEFKPGESFNVLGNYSVRKISSVSDNSTSAKKFAEWIEEDPSRVFNKSV